MKYYHMSFEQLRKQHRYSVLWAGCSLAAFLGLMVVSMAGFDIHMAWALITLFFALVWWPVIAAEKILLCMKK